MANEGEFPKTDGDIAYASEVNHVYNITGSPSYSNAGSLLVKSAASSLNDCGSVVFDNFSGERLIFFSYNVGGTGTNGGGKDESSLVHNGNKLYFSSQTTIGRTVEELYFNESNSINVCRPMVISSGDRVDFELFKDGNAGSMLVYGVNVFGGPIGMTVSGSW